MVNVIETKKSMSLLSPYTDSIPLGLIDPNSKRYMAEYAAVAAVPGPLILKSATPSIIVVVT